MKQAMVCTCGAMPSTIRRYNCETGETSYQVICESCEREAQKQSTQCKAVTEWNRLITEEAKRYV